MSEADNNAKLAFVEPVNADPPCDGSSQLDFLKSINLTQMDQAALVNEVPVTEDEISAIATSEALGLGTLIQTLHSSNSNLLNRANQVEEALIECQKSLQSYQKRLHSAESTVAQQSQELASAQERVRYLSQDVEAYHQKLQHQQILADSLTAQLQTSQERVVQLERESACTQSKYNEQSRQLMQTENVCRELRARLTRQQSHTLQLKLALERSPDAPVFSHQAQPIQSWSALELDKSSHSYPLPSPETISSFEKTDLLKDKSVEKLHLQNLVDMIEPISESVATDLPEGAIDTSSESVLTNTAQHSAGTASSAVLPQVQLQMPESLQQETNLLILDTKWPSPVVYPSRPPKGRKSLAAIELPTFA